jgi:hypothetical protein
LKRGITEFAISILLFINRAARVGWKIREAINKNAIKTTFMIGNFRI